MVGMGLDGTPVIEPRDRESETVRPRSAASQMRRDRSQTRALSPNSGNVPRGCEIPGSWNGAHLSDLRGRVNGAVCPPVEPGGTDPAPFRMGLRDQLRSPNRGPSPPARSALDGTPVRARIRGPGRRGKEAGDRSMGALPIARIASPSAAESATRLFGLRSLELVALGQLDVDPDLAVLLHAGSRRDQATHDHVLLQAPEMVHLAPDGGLREDLGRLLEGGGRDEGLRGEGGLGDAEELGLRRRRRLALALELLHQLAECGLLHLLSDQPVRVAGIDDPHLSDHLADDRLDVLVVDLHALEAVDLLHLVDQVLGELLLALDLEDVVGVLGAVHERLARPDPVALVHAHVLALRNQVLLGVPLLWRHDHAALAPRVRTERDDAIDLRDDGALLRLSGLEELCHPRQAAGDVLRLAGLARN